ncbi:MAG TPA: helix-turn-helix domain-containing protein [Puia sp.]|nr:helix-turn-helix domain-containing protein [Puia sp.]
MWSLLIITSIITQSAVAIFLLNGVRTNDDIHRHLRAMLIILVVHLSTKFLLLAVLKNLFLYVHVPTGFSLAYGPLLLVIARSTLGRPLRPRSILLHFILFFVLSLIYVYLVIAGAIGAVARPEIIGYVSWYQWLALLSLYVYPVYAVALLRGCQTRKAQLVRQIATVLLLAISSAWLVYWVEHRVHLPADFDLRLIPYICLAATPVIILRYRLQATGEAMPPVPATAAQPAPASIAEHPLMSTPAFEPASITADAPLSSQAAPALEVEPAAPATPETAPISDRRYEKSGLDAGRMDAYEAALATFMRKSKIYLDPDLSLDGLASKMKMSKHHLTQLLNERIMKNFYSFINEYRIGEAVDRLNNPALQVNILSLAFDCGFNSRSSFNSYFKKITGHTPTAHRKIALESQPGRNTEAGNPRREASRSAVAAGQGSGRDGKPRRFIRDTSPSA